MKCNKCKNEAHIICPLDLECDCCIQTLNEIIKDDPKSAKILIQRLKNGTKNKTEITKNVPNTKC